MDDLVLWRRFWSRVRIGDGCWEWTGYVMPSGYGSITIGPRGATQRWVVHRLAYEWLVGPIPDGLDIDHECHNLDPNCHGGPCPHRRCVNPSHLAPKTRRQNLRASPHWEGKRTHCPLGHPYDEANTRVAAERPRHGTSRNCRTCDREAHRILRQDPAYEARARELARQWRLKHADDPEWIAKERERSQRRSAEAKARRRASRATQNTTNQMPQDRLDLSVR